MFVLGNPGGGKSTLVKALGIESKGFSRIKSRFTKVTDVDEKTAGIIPYDIHSKALGRVTIYDFAGHKEYYAGHDTLLQNTMTGSPSILSLVVDLREEESKIQENLQYWFQFINNHSSARGPGAHLIIIGSHADEIPSREANTKAQLLQPLASSRNLQNITFIEKVTIDCRYAESSSMNQLRSILSQSCQTLRSSEEIAASLHSFLIFLLDKFSDKLAITFSVAEAELKCHINSREHLYLECVKSSDPFEMCEKLNEHGHILFMKNRDNPLKSWIVLNKGFLLSEVNGVIFAPEGFKEHQDISTSTGVVPLTKLAPLFPNIDTDMITQFLCHLEFCQEIQDAALLPLLPSDNKSPQEPSDRFFFFPGLVKLDTPQDVPTSSTSDVQYNSGWVLQCSNSEQFFSNRFLQVLLLRLAFDLALAPTESTAHHLALHRKCSIWKNGIYWANRSGGEAIVEVINLRKVTVVVHSKQEKIELVKLRTAIISRVINTRMEFCSKVLVKEFLVCPEDAITYPLIPNESSVSITEIAAAVKEGNKFVLNEKNRSIELSKLTYFEPYAYLGESILHNLLDLDVQDQLVADELLGCIASRSCNSSDEYCTIFDNKTEKDILRVFQHWKDERGREGTLKNFKMKLDQFSVFAGRNPLELITGDFSHTDKCSANSSQHHHESDVAASATAAQGKVTRGQSDHCDCSFPRLDAQPKLHELQLLECVHERKVRIIEKVTPNWKTLAIALRFDAARIRTIEKDHKSSTEEACQDMFMRWLEGGHDLASPCTWHTLVKCLNDAGHTDIAESLRKTLQQ